MQPHVSSFFCTTPITQLLSVAKINQIFVTVPPGDTYCNVIVCICYTSKINVLLFLVLAYRLFSGNPLKCSV